MEGRSGLATHILGRHWLHFDELASTNDYVKNNALALPHGTVVTATRQTAGKGRMGRRWDGHPDASLAMSVLLRSWPLEQIPLLPLLAGLAVSEGLEQLTGGTYPIKWSNDVLAGESKLCGILCESRLAEATGHAVIGIGVNLTQRAGDFARLHLVYATSLLLATGRCFTCGEVAAAILNRLELVLEQYQAEGFDGELLARYQGRCITLGRTVRVIRDGAEQIGQAIHIAPDGALICTIGGGLHRILAGEVSVRGLYGYV